MNDSTSIILPSGRAPAEEHFQSLRPATINHRARFLRASAVAMRTVLINHAANHMAKKRVAW